ncbi:MAG: hypothetical protein AAF802_27720, partial [Planctomycetota bacterium]
CRVEEPHRQCYPIARRKSLDHNRRLEVTDEARARNACQELWHRWLAWNAKRRAGGRDFEDPTPVEAESEGESS